MSKLLLAAATQVGITEISGGQDNPEIIKYFSELGLESAAFKDETAWCSAVVNYLCKRLALPYTGKLNARSWLEVGVPVTNPKPGDIVIFWRGAHKDETIGNTDLKKGHVGIYVNHVEDMVYVLGGNQSNSFNLAPYSKHRLLGYRRVEF